MSCQQSVPLKGRVVIVVLHGSSRLMRTYSLALACSA